MPAFVDANKVENRITPRLCGACIEDVNHEMAAKVHKMVADLDKEPEADKRAPLLYE